MSETLDLYQEQTAEGGIIRLSKWPEGYVLWHHGVIVWRSWVKEEAPKLLPELAIAKLQLKAGDLVILKSSERLPNEACHRLREMFAGLLPHGNKVAVLEKLDVAVLSSDGDAA